jgi:CheY-like chemotaxis protein
MSGNIGVESRLGEGSNFWFSLPLELAKEQPKPRQKRLDIHVYTLFETEKSQQVIADILRSWGGAVTQLNKLGDTLMGEVAGAILITDETMMLANKEPLLRLCEQGLKLIALASMNSIVMNEVASESMADIKLIKPICPSELYNALIQLTQTAAPLVDEQEPELTHQLPHYMARVLLAEDDLINQQVASAVLSKFGLNVDIAANGHEAVNALSEHEYELVFMDCMMPVMDGYQATKAIRTGLAGDNNKHIPVVALTADAMSGSEEKCRAAGMDDYMTKPLDPDQMTRVLEKWLGKMNVDHHA